MLDRRHILAAAASVAATWQCGLAQAQTGNAGNVVRIVNGFPAGSSADAVSRLLSIKLAAAGTPHVVENRTGAGGRLAPENVKNSAPDGQSLLITPDAIMTLYPHTYKALSYDPVNDFRAVTTLSEVPVGLVVGPMVPASVGTLKEFAQWCKSNPPLASFGTSGAGTTLHFTGVMFARDSKIEMTHVPYRGGNLAAQDVAAGQIASSVGVLSDVLPLVQAGRLRLLAVSSPERSRFVPNVATFGEQGFKALESTTWYGLFVHARTPEARVASLQAAAVEAFRQPDVADSLSKIGMEPKTMSSAQFAALLKADTARWGDVVKQIGYVGTE